MKKPICFILAMLLFTACDAAPPPPDVAEVTAQIQGQEVVYQAWESSGLPTGGSYYLTSDVELAEAVTLTGNLDLHLNGHAVIAAKDMLIGHMFVIPSGTRMTVYDEPVAEDLFAEYDPEEEQQTIEIATGSIVSSRSFSGKLTVSSMFQVSGELVVAGGHIDASLINVEDRANGLAVYVCEGGKMEMTGGLITGGTTWSFAPKDTGTQTPLSETSQPTTTAPAEPVKEEVSEYGYGGAVYVDQGAQCLLSGGTIWKGSAQGGGNIYVAGDEEGSGLLTITGGRLLAGEATKWGGNVCVHGTLEMSGGSMDWGTSYCDGGNIFLSGTLNMTGGTLRNGACDVNALGYRYGGNLAVDGINASVKITNAQILEGSAACKESHGGNISVVRYGARDFEVGEGTCIYGGRGHRGGNVYIGHLKEDIPMENTDYVFTKVEMNGGTTSYRGGNMCSDTKNKEKPIQVTFNDCIMGVEDSSELNLAIGAGAKDVTQCIITLNGGTFTGGRINLYGSSRLTANGVRFENCDVDGTGVYIENP